jgi:hypothetical protein
MKNRELHNPDELRPEYDLNSLQVRKMGPNRTNFTGSVIQLEPDVAAFFPDSRSVNEALRFLIRITREKTTEISEQQP